MPTNQYFSRIIVYDSKSTWFYIMQLSQPMQVSVWKKVLVYFNSNLIFERKNHATEFRQMPLNLLNEKIMK